MRTPEGEAGSGAPPRGGGGPRLAQGHPTCLDDVVP